MKKFLGKKLLFVDIETVSEEVNLESFSEKNPDMCNIFKGYAQNIREKFEDLDDNDLYKRYSGLYPEFGKIIVASFGFITPKGEMKIETFSGDEEELLVKVNSLLNRTEELDFWLCGHNIRNFDLPFIAKRMFLYGIEPSRIIPTTNFKPWELKIIDLKDMWQMGNPQNFSKLGLISTFLKLNSSKLGEVTNTSIYEEYWEKNNLNGIIKYCEDDVSALMNIVERLKNLKNG